jgi:hypothetical protein
MGNFVVKQLSERERRMAMYGKQKPKDPDIPPVVQDVSSWTCPEVSGEDKNIHDEGASSPAVRM